MARITVVDDYPEFLSAMYAILDGVAGHAVAAFSGSDASIEELVRTMPELLILDLHVIEDGDESQGIASLAQSEPALRNVPIIICSGDVPRLRDEATRLRANGVYTLAKPFDVADLTALVDRALREGTGGVSAPA
jgi:CheY-like chemotaxis protein